MLFSIIGKLHTPSDHTGLCAVLFVCTVCVDPGAVCNADSTVCVYRVCGPRSSVHFIHSHIKDCIMFQDEAEHLFCSIY
jgi:hypothetical protein